MAVSWRSYLLELQFKGMCVWRAGGVNVSFGDPQKAAKGISKLGPPLGKVHLKPCALLPDFIADEKLGIRLRLAVVKHLPAAPFPVASLSWER